MALRAAKGVPSATVHLREPTGIVNECALTVVGCRITPTFETTIDVTFGGLAPATPTGSARQTTTATATAMFRREALLDGISHPFPRGCMCVFGRSQVSWLPGLSVAPSQSLDSSGCASIEHLRLTSPVTVAGPRRILTGLPLNHRPMNFLQLERHYRSRWREATTHPRATP